MEGGRQRGGDAPWSLGDLGEWQGVGSRCAPFPPISPEEANPLMSLSSTERPLRDYEVLHEVQQGWNRDSLVNYFFVRRCKFSALLQIGVCSSPSPSHLPELIEPISISGRCEQRPERARAGLAPDQEGQVEQALPRGP